MSLREFPPLLSLDDDICHTWLKAYPHYCDIILIEVIMSVGALFPNEFTLEGTVC